MPDIDPTQINAGVSAGLEQFQKTYANGKIADSIVKVNPEILDSLGISREQFGSLSAPDRTSAVTGYITAQGIKAQQQQMQAQAADTAAQAQERQLKADTLRQANAEDTAVGEAGKRFGMGPPNPAMTPAILAASGAAPLQPGAQGPTVTPDMIAPYNASYQDRLNYALQTPGLGGKAAAKFLAVLPNLNANKNTKGLPIGSQTTLQDGTVITGTGEANEPNVRPPKAAEGLEVGQTLTDTEGNQWFGKGKGTAPEFKAASDVKAAKNAGDTGRGRSVFMQSAPEMARQLDNLEQTIVANNGNAKETTWDPAAVAALGQLPFQIAENYNKVVDPHSINRPEKLQQDMVHLLPMGVGTRKDVTLAAIQNLRSELVNRVRNFATVEKELPPNLPPAIQNKLIGTIPNMAITVHPDTKFDNEAQARAAGVKNGDVIQLRDPKTGTYRKARLVASQGQP